MGYGVIDKHIAGVVEHLYTFMRRDVESLTCLVGREGTILPAGMPIGIDHRATQLVIAGFQPFSLSVYLEHGGTMVATHMKDKLRGVGLMGRMAVDTHAWHLSILYDRILIEGREVALIEAHLTECLIAWSNTAVGQSPLIEGIRTDADRKVLVLLPLAVLQDTDGKGELSALVLLSQLVPIVYIKVSLIALNMHLTALRAAHHHIHAVDISLHTVKVQWSDLCRNRHPDIVRIDRRQLTYLYRVLWSRTA